VLVQPEAVLKGCLARGRREVLVRWKEALAAESAWVDLEEFYEQFPDFQLEDELLLQGGRDVMCHKHFSRRKKAQAPTSLVRSLLAIRFVY
jgi:predicted ester cyclase